MDFPIFALSFAFFFFAPSESCIFTHAMFFFVWRLAVRHITDLQDEILEGNALRHAMGQTRLLSVDLRF